MAVLVYAAALAASAAPMHFIQVPGYIVAYGDITPETPAKFRQLTIPRKTVLYFDSPGGNLMAALELGRLIRRAGVTTYVAPQGDGCFSACVYAFAGGVVRRYDGQAPLGVHQFYGGGGTESSVQSAVALVARYLDEMGVDLKLVEAASFVLPDDIQTIPVKVAREWRLDNSQVGAQPATASTPTRTVTDAAMTEESCAALGERVFVHERAEEARRGNKYWVEGFENEISHYDPVGGHCYVQINRGIIGVLELVLHDGHTGEVLAQTLQKGIWPPNTEFGFIKGTLETGKPGTIEQRRVEGHAAYLQAKAFIDARLK
jgi:hypothetical protein